MPHDIHRFVDAVQTKHGVRFVSKPETINAAWRQNPEVGEQMIRQRAELMSVRTRDGLLSSAVGAVNSGIRGATSAVNTATTGVRKLSEATAGDAEEEDPGYETEAERTDPRVIGELPPPPEGQHYEIEPGEDGSWAVVLVAGPPPNATTAGDGKSDPKLRAFNDAARALWGNKTRDGRYTLFVHYLPKGSNEKLSLEGPDADGKYVLILSDDDGPSLTANTPVGASGSGPRLASPGAVPPESNRTGDKLRQMNSMARSYWGRGRR
jgi:hypothetical protein